MITHLDHMVLICADIEEGIASYQTLLGREPDWLTSDTEAGSATALFEVNNTALELLAPRGSGPVAARLNELIDEGGSHLTSLAFGSSALDETHRMMTRRGLEPSDIEAKQSRDLGGRGGRSWRSYRCNDNACVGIKTFVLQRDAGKGEAVIPDRPLQQSLDQSLHQSTVHALDHLVINTPNPDRAIAHYGARLGLDFRLDRVFAQWDTRFLFFRTGSLTFEVVHRLADQQNAAASDRMWGLTWAVADLSAAHDRLSTAGVDVSEIRTGRKPGTQVFSVKSGTLNVPTLFITHEAQASH